MNRFSRLRTVIFQIVMLAGALSPTNASALQTRGLWVQIERRGYPVEYWPGQVIQNFNQFDSVVGHNVSDEVALQLDAMRAMGVNTITIELRSADADANNTFPTCDVSPALGFQWPQPTATELANIVPFFDLVHSKGIKILLVLVNMHMEQLPRTNSQTWIGAILNAVKDHPALSAVIFNGDTRTIDTNGDGVPDACGIQAEAPLWLGPGSVPANYVSWAIGYAMSLGLPSSKLSAGTVVGDFFTDSEPPAGPDATDGHLWKPTFVMKSILDGLGIPNSQRFYSLSFYEHRKCFDARQLQCTDADPPTWADQTLQDVYSVIGTNNGARVVAYEMGNNAPVDPNWSTPSALANLVQVLTKYGAEGGSFWRWASFSDSEDSDTTLALPIKLRGTAFNYTAAKTTLVELYKPSHDFTGDAMSDILWRDTGGDVAIWAMNGGTVSAAMSAGNVPAAWSIAGQRDFDGDGISDILWRDTSGNVAIWTMAGGAVSSSLFVGNTPLSWSIAGTGDFDGDGKGDILWRDTGGNVAIWLMNGGTVTSSVPVGNVPTSWSIAGSSGNVIVWRDTAGNTALWTMNGGTVTQSVSLGNVPTTWSIVGTGDFDGDGNTDILWRDSSGNVAIWLLGSNGTVASSAFIGNVPASWSVAETGDFNDDGKSDILWRDTGGDTAIWLMNGATVTSSTLVANVPTAWTIQGANAD